MGLKDRLAHRKRPSTVYQLRIEDTTEPSEELVAAQAAGDETRIVTARAAVEACYELLHITALPPVEMEELLAEHPPTEEQQKNKSLFNRVTFVPAFLAACIDSDVTEAEWDEYTTQGALTTGEVNDLFNTVWELNYRPPSPYLPKG